MADASPHDYTYITTERDFLALLIDLYRSKPVLWQIKHKNYHDKLKRLQALHEIVEELKVYKADFTIDLLKKKIYILRTCFHKARHKLETERLHDEDAKPTLWYFDALSFLTDQCNDKRPRITVVDSEPGDESDEEQNSYVELEESEPIRKTATRKSLHETTLNKRKPETDQDESDSEVEQYMKVTTTYYKKKKTKEDILAKLWVQKLTDLAADQRVFAEKIINDVLIEGEMGNLSRNGVSFRPPH